MMVVTHAYQVEALYPVLTPALLSMAGRALNGRPEDAEDVVQECWARLVKAAPTFESLSHARAFMYTTLRRIIIDLYRRGRPQAELVETSAIAEDTYPAVEYAEWFAVVDSLTDRERRLAACLAVGYSVAEGAERMGMTASNYKVATHRLRERLR